MADFDLNDALTPRQTALLAALIAGQSLTDAARAARVSLRTAQRYTTAPAFRRALADVQAARLASVVAAAHAVGDESVRVLQAIANDPAAPASARVAAARHLDARRWRALEFGSLRAEVDQLEQRLQAREQELNLCQAITSPAASA